MNNGISLEFCAQIFPFDLSILKHFFKNKNKKSVKFQEDLLTFREFILIFCIYHKSQAE